MSSTDTTTTAAFVGWRRSHPKSPWLAVATGGTRAACWDALLAVVGNGGEAMVLEAGRDPDRRPAYRRGVR